VPAPWSLTGALVGLLGNGSVYILGEDGQFHYIDAATFAAKGYDGNAVSWLSQLPANIGAPMPAVAPAPAPEATVVPRAPESVAVVVPAIGKGLATPAKVLAGKKVVLSFPITDAATGAAVTELTMFSSNPKIGNTIVRHVEKLVGGQATITLTVPKTAAGKSLQVGLTVKSGDQSASKTQTFPIH
jgi:hypothetical protein